MSERDRTRSAGWPEPDGEDADQLDGPRVSVTFTTPPFHDVFVVPIDGQDDPVVITRAGTAVPVELADTVRTAAAASGLALSEAP